MRITPYQPFDVVQHRDRQPAQRQQRHGRPQTAVEPVQKQGKPDQHKKTQQEQWRQVYQEQTASAHHHHSKVKALDVYSSHTQVANEPRRARFIDTYV